MQQQHSSQEMPNGQSTLFPLVYIGPSLHMVGKSLGRLSIPAKWQHGGRAAAFQHPFKFKAVSQWHQGGRAATRLALQGGRAVNHLPPHDFSANHSHLMYGTTYF